MKIKTDNYEIYKGDCLEAMDKLIEQGVKVDCVICDPPFNTTSCDFDKNIIDLAEMWVRLKKIAKPNSPIVLFGAMPFTAKLVASHYKGYKHHWIWKKNRGTGFQVAKYRPMMATEDIIVFTPKGERVNYYPQMIPLEKPTKYSYSGKSKHNYGTNNSAERLSREITHKYPINVIECAKVAKPIHPTEKPVKLMEYLVNTFSNEGEVILDFTMGSGSTGVACILTDRKFIGVELDDKYFEIAENRLKEATEKKEELLKVFDKSN